MKNPKEIGTILKERVYTVPTYTNLYGTKVSGNNATIKFYTRNSNIANHGVMPISLVKTLLLHYEQKESLTSEEKAISNKLVEVYGLFKT